MQKTLREKNGLEWLEWRGGDGVLNLELTGKGFLTDEETSSLAASFLTEEDYVLLLEESANVYRPQDEMTDLFGEDNLEDRLLLAFRKEAISLEACPPAYEGLRGAAGSSKNRGLAAGRVDPSKMSRPLERIVVMPGGNGTRFKYISEDGILSDTTEANPVLSGIVGNYGSNPRNPYCRQTSYTRDNPELFLQAMPFVQEVDRNFKQTVPSRWASQQEFMAGKNISENGWGLGDTVFTTVTVNKNFQTAVHRDAGDYGKGFGNLTVIEGGKDKYRGGHTVFPKFRVAADVRTGDFLAMDVHEWHGNTLQTSLVEGADDWERISFVCYCRVDLVRCGTREEENLKHENWKRSELGASSRHVHEIRAERLKGEEAENSVLFDLLKE
jgi:hypothetical protein